MSNGNDLHVSQNGPGRPWRIDLLLLIFGLLAHGQLLLADGVRWDDALFHKLDRTGNYAELKAWMMEMGLPINYLFFRTVLAFPGYESHLVLSFLSIVLCAAVLHRYLTDHLRWSIEDATLFSALFIFCLPFKSVVLFCTLQYQYSLVFFLLACYLSEKRFGPNGNAWLFAALALFLLSFNTASLLAYFYVYFLASFLSFVRFHGSPVNLGVIVAWLRKSWLLLIWPFTYFALKLSLFPSHGLYENYNKLKFDLGKLMTTSRIYFEDGFVNPVTFVARLDAQLPSTIVLIAGAIFLLFQLPAGGKDRSHALSLSGIRLPWYLVGLAFCLSFLPYALVGQAPRPLYWESRHLLLFALTIPMIAFAIVRVVSLLFGRVTGTHPRHAAGLLTAFVCAAYCLFGYVNYFIVQIGSIKQQAIVENLRKQPHLMAHDFFSVVDEAKDFGGNRLNLYEATHDNYYGWALVFTQAWGEERWFGYSFDEFRRDKPQRLARYGTSKINPNGHWCSLTIKQNPGRSQWQIYYQYYWVKFVDKSGLQPFLESLVSISGCDTSGQTSSNGA